jgi:spoIIIJ-associated protein
MIRARKYAGKTVDEATEIALADLDAELEDVEIKIVSTGRSGILGFGGEPAEIEISLLSDGRSSFSDDFDEEAVADSPEESAESAPRAASADFEEETPRNRGRSRNRNRGRGRGRSNRDGDEEQQPEAVASSSEAPATEATDEEKPSNGRRGRRGARGGRDAERSPSNERDERPEAHARPERDDQDDRPQREELLDRPEREQRPQNNEDSQPIIREKDEEAEQLVSELIDYFLGAMGVVAETYIREDDEEGSMTFEIEGQDAGLLIGRRGETLQALQFLIRMVTNRQLGRKAYVVIDIEDYRERRVQMLRRLARRTAGRVASSGRDDSLEPMSPAERRIVHMALAGHSEVRTESEGEGNQRRVVIFPTD